jgi:glycosyltransferase involved in cell wall biosynthesis
MTLSRVGLNAVFLRPRMGGLETYVRRLVPELVRLRPNVRFVLFLGQLGQEALADEPWLDEVEIVTHPLLGRPWLTAVSELTVLAVLADRQRLDVLHSVPMTGPLRVKAAHVVLVGDLIWLHDPATVPRLTGGFWRTVVPQVVRRADRVLTFSEATRDDLASLLGVPLDRIDVAPLGHGAQEAVEPTPADELRERLRLGEGPVVFTVSAKRTHKNLLRLLHAFARVRETVPDAVLILPGNPTPHEEELKQEARALGLADAVRFVEYVGAADLEGLYALASAFVFPSLHEGFGLPILEAMRRGVPVACSNASSLPEVGGDAVRYFDPLDADDMAAALVELLTDFDLAQRLVEAGARRAATFTWKRTAELTLESYERALG